MLPYIPYMDPMGKLDNFDSHLFIVVDLWIMISRASQLHPKMRSSIIV